MSMSVPSIWSNEIIDQMKEELAVTQGMALGDPIKRKLKVKLNPEMEAFFVALALEHGTHPEPTFGMERNRLAQSMTSIMMTSEAVPALMRQLQRNYVELGGKMINTDPTYFYNKLADAYLDWLYAQPESMALMEQALKKNFERNKKESGFGQGFDMIYKRIDDIFK